MDFVFLPQNGDAFLKQRLENQHRNNETAVNRYGQISDFLPWIQGSQVVKLWVTKCEKNQWKKYLKQFASLKCQVNLQGIFWLPRNFTLPVPPHFMPKSMTLNDGLLLNSLMMASRFSPGGVDWSILQYLIARDVELASRQNLDGKYIYI